MYRGAMRSILSELIRRGRLLVVDEFTIGRPKTKDMAVRLATLGLNDVLIVTPERNDTLALASRNLPHVSVQHCEELSPVSLLSFDSVVMTVAAAKRLEERLA